MTTEKMTIHKALSELKLIDARIAKALTQATFCVANKHSNTKIGGVNISEAIAGMEGDYARATDLIRRRDAIKRAVVLSNARAEVEIGEKTYTVAEAIDAKQHGIVCKEELLRQMSKQYRGAQAEINKNNGEELDKRAEAYVIGIFGGKDAKVDPAIIAKAKEDFVKAQTYELVDPMKIKDKMEALEKEISDFTSEVDGALSTSNALTFIEVSY